MTQKEQSLVKGTLCLKGLRKILIRIDCTYISLRCETISQIFLIVAVMGQQPTMINCIPTKGKESQDQPGQAQQLLQCFNNSHNFIFSIRPRFFLDFALFGSQHAVLPQNVYNFVMRAIKQPIYSYTQRIPPPEDLISNAYKYNPYQTNPNLAFKELRSLSKNKKKLRYHLFKNKNLVTQSNFYSPNRPEQTKMFSSYVNLPPPTMQEPKQIIKISEDKLIAKKMQKKEASVEKTEVQAEKKQKRQFKLIHQIKKQKVRQNKQKMMADQEQSDIYHQKIGHIEAKGNKKIEIFAEELHQILHSQEEIKPKVASHVSVRGSEVFENQLKTVFEPNFRNENEEDKVIEVETAEQPRETAQNIDESYRQPDLNRSCLKAEQILKKRKNSSSSIDISMRLSKVREEMNLSLALQSINNTKSNMSELFKDIIDSKGKGKDSKAGTIDRLRIHIRILQTLSQFVYQSTNFDIVTQQWQELNFLIYKKYYIERVKIVNFIKKYPMKNPFFIYNAEISSKEIIDFMKTEEGGRFKAEIIKETAEIKNRLSSFYSHFDKSKVGEKINLFQYDNFSHWIIEQLWAELILTEYNTSHQRQVINSRMCRILQLIFLISQLNGKYEFPFEEAESAIRDKDYQPYIREGKEIFEKYILYKSS